MSTSRNDEETKKDAARSAYDRAPLVPQRYPWLVALHGKQQNQKQSFYSVSERRYHVRTIPELRNKLMRACCDGWLVLDELDSSECFLFNLVSKERIQLPISIEDQPDLDPSDNYDIDCLLLSFPPSNPECQVVFLCKDKESSTISVYYCKPGDTEFRSETFCIIDDVLTSSVVLKGRIYMLTKVHSYLYLIDFVNQRPELTLLLDKPFQKQVPADLHGFESWLVASCEEDELFLVYKMYFGVCIREAFGFLIFKLDSSEESWIEVESIGKERALFINEDIGMMCSTTSEELSHVKGNTIYFTQYGDRSLYVFDMENNTISSNLPFPVARNAGYSWINIPIDTVE